MNKRMLLVRIGDHEVPYSGLDGRQWGERPSAGRFYPDLVIDCTAKCAVCIRGTFCGLDGNVTKQELDLLQLTARGMAEPSTGPT
jgi:hypothetical protein